MGDRCYGNSAIASISTRTPRGSPATCTVERAGRASPSMRPYISFIAGKSFMSARNTVVFTTCLHEQPAAARTPARLLNARSVCAFTSPVTTCPVAGSSAICPATGQVVTGDVKAQTERALSNLTGVLAAAGCSWRHVVKTTVFLADMNDFPAMNDMYGRMLGDARPARSTVQVAGLPRGVLVEIDAIAELP